MSAGVRGAPPSARSEEGVLARVAAGEPGAADALLERFGGLVWSLARRLAANDSEAEDVVQEIFIDLWRSAGRYDPSIASETAFVATIARRRLIDRRRRETRRLDKSPLVADAAERAGADRVAVCEEAAVAARALEQLSAEQQRVLRLSILHGLTHERIAETTGLPLGTVKTHARRGLIKVRDMLASSRKGGGR